MIKVRTTVYCFSHSTNITNIKLALVDIGAGCHLRLILLHLHSKEIKLPPRSKELGGVFINIVPFSPFKSFLEERGCGGRKPIFQKRFPSPANYINLNQSRIYEAILIGIVACLEAVPDAALLIEVCGSDRE